MSKLSHALTVDDWDVRITDANSGRVVTLHPEQTDRFWADPFLYLAADGSPTMLCEEFDYATNLGTVVEVTLTSSLDVNAVTPILGTGQHESYPFVFQHEGERYCLPETSALGKVFLYQSDGLGWIRKHTLLEDFAGLDTTLVVQPSGDLWLFSTPLEDPYSLHVWHATSLDGPWQPHQHNPVVSSMRGGRQAGGIRTGTDGLIRPGQNSTERYGGSIVEFDIAELTLDRYREAERHEIEPPAGYSGIHTINEAGGFTVVDAARRTSVLRHPSFIKWRLKKTMGRL